MISMYYSFFTSSPYASYQLAAILSLWEQSSAPSVASNLGLGGFLLVDDGLVTWEVWSVLCIFAGANV